MQTAPAGSLRVETRAKLSDSGALAASFFLGHL